MNNIKKLRQEKGLTQKQLAKEVHITQTAVSQWELGKTAPDKQIANKLADFFGVTLDFILGRTTERTSSYYASNINDSNFVQGNGTITVGENSTSSCEEAELLRIYRALDVRNRAKLLNTAFALEDEVKEGH